MGFRAAYESTPPPPRPNAGAHPPGVPSAPARAGIRLSPQLREALKFAGWTSLCLVVAVSCFAAGRGYRIPWPTPIPTPAPIPKPDGPLRVILLVDNGANLSQGQLSALASTKVRGWLDEHCDKDAEGRPAWRQWDPDIDVTNEAPDWRDLWRDVKGSVGTPPQVVVFRGQKGKSYPLPDSPDALIQLLEGK